MWNVSAEGKLKKWLFFSKLSCYIEKGVLKGEKSVTTNLGYLLNKNSLDTEQSIGIVYIRLWLGPKKKQNHEMYEY
jgi:hypothetical protein